MKFLLCIGGGEMSHDTIATGGKIAAAFHSDLSVLYVEAKKAGSMTGFLDMSRMKLSEWEIELPGVKVLQYAEQVLKDMNLLEVDESGDMVEKHSLRPDINGAYELHALGKQGENIRLRLREGDIIDEVIKEVELGGYNLVFMGASKERRLVHRMIQFISPSLFITKNLRDIDYRFLFAVDDSELSRRALYLGSKAAKFLKSEATLLSVVDKEENIGMGEVCLAKGEKILKRMNIPYTTKIVIGDPIETIIKEAGDDHIIAMGSSKKSQLSKFFKATKAVKVVQDCNCPVLIVK